jgi:hypothetical protein
MDLLFVGSKPMPSRFHAGLRCERLTSQNSTGTGSSISFESSVAFASLKVENGMAAAGSQYSLLGMQSK